MMVSLHWEPTCCIVGFVILSADSSLGPDVFVHVIWWKGLQDRVVFT